MFCIHVSGFGFLHLAETKLSSVLDLLIRVLAFNDTSELAIAPYCNCTSAWMQQLYQVQGRG